MDDPSPPPPPAHLAAAPPDAPEAPRRARLRWSPLWVALGAVLVLVATSSIVASVASAPYVVYSPGSAIDTGPAISAPGVQTFPPDGSVLFLTVSLRGASTRMSYTEAVWGWLHPDSDVFPRRLLLGDQSGEESRQRSLQAMAGSQQLAAKVALEHLGYEVPQRGAGAAVLSTIESAPVAEVLEPGDVIVEVGGQPIEVQEELRGALDEVRPGDEVELVVERGAALQAAPAEPVTDTVTVELIADPEDAERALLGVTVATWQLEYELPVPIDIDTEDVGGPSAGLALTLGILDLLTEGSLTGGNTIAVSGEITPDGSVAEVGGVGQKAVAAREAGADLILVPASEADLAEASAGAVPVVGVETLQDALEALADLGGNALEIPRDGAG